MNAGSGGDTIATDDIGGVKHQLVKVEYGAADSATPVSTANPLPVDLSGASVADGGTLPSKGVQVGGTDGTVFQVLSTDSAGRLNANINGTVPVSDNSGSLTVDAPVGTPVFVRLSDGSSAIATLPVSGPLTDTQLRASAVPTAPAPANTVSSANSSTATLAGGATFTGTSEDIRDYAIVYVSVFSNVASATDGLSLQQSSDGTNWDFTDTYTIPAGVGKVISINPGARFFRVVYTNGAGAQGSFRLQTVYKRFYGKPSSQRPGDTYSNEFDAEQVSSFPMVWNGTSWDRMPGGATNGLTQNLKALNGTTVSTNSGTVDAGTQRVILASNQSVVPVSDNSSSLTVDAPVGTPVFTTVTPSTTGGWSKVKYAAQATTVQTPKGTAANFGGYYAYNPNASIAYVQVFDAATATTITLGTTSPDMIFAIPAGSAANLEITNGVNMANGIKLACTTTATGSTAPGTGLDLTIFYK